MVEHYLIDESEIQTSSDNGIVVIWLEEYARPGVTVTQESIEVFGDKDMIDVGV